MRGFMVVVSLAGVLASCETTGPIWWNQVYGNPHSSSFIDIRTEDATTLVWEQTLWSSAEIFPSDPVVTLNGAIVVSGSREAGDVGPELVPQGRVKCIEKDSTVRFDVPVVLDVVSTPAVSAQGKIFVTLQSAFGGDNRSAPRLVCLDRLGVLQWSHEFFHNPVLSHIRVSPPKVSNGRVFVCYSQRLFVFELDGTIVSTVDLHSRGLTPGSYSPSIGGSLYPIDQIAASKGQACFAFSPAIDKDNLVWQSSGEFVISVHWDPSNPPVRVDIVSREKIVTPLAVSRDGQKVYTAIKPQPPDPDLSALPSIDHDEFLRVMKDETNPGVTCTAAIDTSPPYGGSLFHMPPSLWNDRADFLVYYPQEFWLKGTNVANCATFSSFLHSPSAATVTRTRVHVSDKIGLHTFWFTLASSTHALAALPAVVNLAVRQPAVGFGGEVYEVVMTEQLSPAGLPEVSSRLRAFAGPQATR